MPIPPSAPTPPAPPRPSAADRRRAILDAIARGRLDAAGGLAALREVSGQPPASESGASRPEPQTKQRPDIEPDDVAEQNPEIEPDDTEEPR